MKILVAGATGFIGSHVVHAFRQAGHDVREVVRMSRPVTDGQVRGDFRIDTDPALWQSRLGEVDVVVNAVGVLRETRASSFSTVHIQGPRALFSACAQAGVRKVIQISALGADEEALSRYHVSKANADRHLMSLPLQWIVLRPSLVFGPGGASTRLFSGMASLPLVPLVGNGQQRVQPVHVDDLAQLCVRLAAGDEHDRRVIDVVGPQVFTSSELLASLRTMLGLGRIRFLRVPLQVVRAASVMAGWMPRSGFDREVLGMLERGSTADPAPFAAALGHAPRPAVPYVDADDARRWREPLLASARNWWALPLLRSSLALIWIVTGLLSLGLFPVDESLALLGRVGLAGMPARVALYGAAALDIAMGAGLLLSRRRTWLWRAQIVLVALYSVVIAIGLPEFWLHPFGPLLKNVALLAMMLVLHEADRQS